MDKFKASFRFYAQGAPYPGICLRCSAGSKLWDLGRNIPGTNMAAYYCDGCLVELATFTGMKPKDKFEAEVNRISTELAKSQEQLKVVPKLIEELTRNVSNLFSEFVTDLASVSTTNNPVQPKGDQADTGKSAKNTKKSTGNGEGSAEADEPSSKSAE